MKESFPYEILDDPEILAQLQLWSADVYRDFLALQSGSLNTEEFDAKHMRRTAILTLDMTGFTQSSRELGQIAGLLRIFDVQKVCVPVLKSFKATLIRAFADDLVALFDEPNDALDASFEIHRRIAIFNSSDLSSGHPAECAIGIGYGNVYAIGPNLAQGNEMNLSSKLGEDTARGHETLLTKNAFHSLKNRTDITFQELQHDDQLFEYYQVWPNNQ